MEARKEEKTLEKEAFTNMQGARSELLLSHPFFASLGLKLELKSDKSCQDLWTDGKVLAYNPYFVSLLSKEHLVCVQAHEIMHLACGHHLRRQGREEKLWNRACDYAVNSILEEAGFSLPKNLLTADKSYSHMSVDEIYVELKRLYDQDIHGGANQAQVAEQGDDNDNASSSGKFDSSKEENKLSDKKDKKGENKEDEDFSNSSKDAFANKDSENKNDDNSNSSTQSSTAFFGEVKDHPLLSDEHGEEGKKKAELESMIQLSQAMQASEFMGDVPLALLRLYKETLRPQLDWRVLLQRFIENCNDGDYTWSSPNKRYISQNLYLPSRKEPRIPQMALAIDASGSVDKQSLSLFCSELESILENYDTKLYILYHDVKVYKHERYSREDRPLKLMPEGGGGTDYRHIPKYIEQEDIEPSCLIWFTDFECDLFPEEPNYPLLWVSSKKKVKDPPFGEAIYLEI